jgi:hypothetical protein
MQLSFVTKVVGELEKEVRGGGGNPRQEREAIPPPTHPTYGSPKIRWPFFNAQGLQSDQNYSPCFPCSLSMFVVERFISWPLFLQQ